MLNTWTLNSKALGGDSDAEGSVDWTQFLPVERQSIYILDIGSHRFPVTSVQATMRKDGQSFLQAIVPDGATHAATLATLLQESMILRSGYRYADGSLSPLEDIATAPLQTPRRSEGATRDTITLSGYGFRPPSSGQRTLSGVQTRTTEADGRRRVRCSIDLRLRPGQFAQDTDGVTFQVGVIQYFINASSEGMEVIQDG